MATLTIRDVPEETKKRLRIRAAEHGRSMEAELRAIVDRAVHLTEPPENFARAIRRQFSALGGLELELPEREPLGDPPDLSA